ncbi:hypothetical protein M8371_25455, partial [Klebsiella pneumoniae]|nr:hypothetical protein [Klebsiella pneumoniae]
GTVCVVGKMRDLILQLSKSSIYSTNPWDANAECLKNEYGMSNEKIEEIRAKLHKLNRNVGLY